MPGIGPKTAARLLQEFDSLEQLATGLDRVPDLPLRGAKGVVEKLQRHWPQVLIARRLTGLEEHIPDIDVVPNFVLDPRNLGAVADYLEELNLGGPLVKRCQALQQSLSEAKNGL